MRTLTIVALRAVLVGLLAGSLFVLAVIVPLLAIDLRETQESGAEFPRTAVLVITVLWIVAAQVVLVCVWRLVTMVRHNTVFTPRTFRFVDVVIGAFVASAGLTFALGVVLAPGEAVAPGIVLLIGGVALAILGVALVVLVMRMLLAQAIARDAEASAWRSELDEVI